MEHIEQALKNAEQKIARSSKTSPIEAGPANSETQAHQALDREALIDAINQVFSLFRINFHNQFYAAYNDSETLNQAKKMWLESLKNFDVSTLLIAAKRVIESSEYLPTVHRFMTLCDEIHYALPPVRVAFEEACLSTEPRENHPWSHPVVYHAGKASGWFFLRGQPERTTFPVFEKHYDALVKRIRQGEQLTLPEKLKLEQKEVTPLPVNEQKKHLEELLKILN